MFQNDRRIWGTMPWESKLYVPVYVENKSKTRKIARETANLKEQLEETRQIAQDNADEFYEVLESNRENNVKVETYARLFRGMVINIPQVYPQITKEYLIKSMKNTYLKNKKEVYNEFEKKWGVKLKKQIPVNPNIF